MINKILLLAILLLPSMAFGIDKKTPSGNTIKDKIGQSQIPQINFGQKGLPGEKITAGTMTAISQASPGDSVYYDITGASITLTPGSWIVYWRGSTNVLGVNTSDRPTTSGVGLRIGSTTIDNGSVYPSYFPLSSKIIGSSASNYAFVNTPGTYKLSAFFSGWGPGGAVSASQLDASAIWFYAIRLTP